MHPDLAGSTGARVLVTIGHDSSARELKAYVGSAPVTRASRRSISVGERRTKNDRLAAAGWSSVRRRILANLLASRRRHHTAIAMSPANGTFSTD